MSRPRPLTFAAAAAACVLAAAIVWLLAFHSTRAAWVDAITLQGFMGLDGEPTRALAEAVAGLGDPVPFAFALAGIVAIALLRGRGRLALLAAGAPLAAAITTQILKPVLADPRSHEWLVGLHVSAAAWPSGHTTAAMSLALALVVVVPGRLRPLAAAAGGLFTIAMVYSLMLLGWHFPSDVLGGLCVATGWTLAGAAALGALEGRRLSLEALRTPALALATAAAAAATVVLARADAALAYAESHTTFVAAAGAIAVAALVPTAVFAATLRP